ERRWTRRSSPPRPSSPRKTVRPSAGRSLSADAGGAATPRAAAGARRRSPPPRVADTAAAAPLLAGAVAPRPGTRATRRGSTQAALPHFEHADLVGRAEPVLRPAQDAEGVEALALEIEDRVDDVLQDPRPRDVALLRHVTHEEDRDVVTLRDLQEPRCALAQLRHAAGRGTDDLRAHRLDRIDD